MGKTQNPIDLTSHNRRAPGQISEWVGSKSKSSKNSPEKRCLRGGSLLLSSNDHLQPQGTRSRLRFHFVSLLLVFIWPWNSIFRCNWVSEVSSERNAIQICDLDKCAQYMIFMDQLLRQSSERKWDVGLFWSQGSVFCLDYSHRWCCFECPRRPFYLSRL